MVKQIPISDENIEKVGVFKEVVWPRPNNFFIHPPIQGDGRILIGLYRKFGSLPCAGQRAGFVPDVMGGMHLSVAGN